MSAMLPGADYAGDDFYCDVAFAHLDALDVVERTERVVAFHHTKPHWEHHVVVVPFEHIASLTTLTPADADVARELLEVVARVAARFEREHGAARVLTNLGRYQDSKHLHVHVGAGRRRRSAEV
jgi:histidine triad (HIT) family protein